MVSFPLRRDSEEREEIRTSIEFLKKNIRNADIIEVFPQGRSRLERLGYPAFFNDLANYHLALEKGIDPAAAEYINRLKEIIKE